MIKKIILLSSLCFVYAASFSQVSESAEAEKNLAKATENLKAKKYQDALLSIAKAKEETIKLFSAQLVAALPKTVDGWNQNPPPERSGPAAMMPMAQVEISVTRTYSNPSLKKPEQTANTEKKEAAPGTGASTSATTAMAMPGMMQGTFGEPSVSVTITNNSMWANEVAMAHANTDNPGYSSPGMEGAKSSPIKVADFRALEKFDTNRKSGSVTVIAGAGVIKIDGNNIESKDILLKMANAIDYKIVKSVLGE